MQSAFFWSTLVAGIGAIFALTILLASEGRQPGIDSHYHFKMAEQIAQGNLLPSMAKALPLTVYNVWDVDHYWGFHVILAPFAMISDPDAGMKVATVFMFCTVLLSLHTFLRSRQVQFAWLWTLVPLMLTTIAWRYLQLRGAQLLVPLLLLFIAFAFYGRRDRRRRLAIFAVAYVAMLSYQGAIVLLTAHIAGLMAWWILAPASFPTRKRLWEPLLTAGGLAAGLTFNPYMDGSGKTWAFAEYHLFTMGVDRDGLYGRIAEFHGFAPEWFMEHLEWLVFTLAVIVGLLWVLRRRVKGQGLSQDQAVNAGLAALGIVMTAMATRATEYSVIFGVLFLASLVPRVESRSLTMRLQGVLSILLAAGLWYHAGQTMDALNSRSTLHTHMYRGAKDILSTAGTGPVLNLVEADYNVLLWEYEHIRCVQGLSRYFLITDKQTYNDIQLLKHPRSTARSRLEALRRFASHDVRLVANHLTKINGQPTAFAAFAGTVPHMLTPLFRSPPLPHDSRVGMLYRVNYDRIAACLDHGRCRPPTRR